VIKLHTSCDGRIDQPTCQSRAAALPSKVVGRSLLQSNHNCTMKLSYRRQTALFLMTWMTGL